jgi:hypothetical protein
MHQPLHLCGRDRGGNGDKVHWDGRVTSASLLCPFFLPRFSLAAREPHC